MYVQRMCPESGGKTSSGGVGCSRRRMCREWIRLGRMWVAIAQGRVGTPWRGV
ncbi:hypothetical protein BCR44DRAFT_1425593 [Catenaria anguillulae PL171]|uniref:Uncharacterized protein n=1 Tax=Catenaria anguillulae PL171 TaxID=765915 RepID=A0A1Y2I1C8_9FUNG|nr:hypothetical protein BCR44DRAFT_1425593 [Catenaria anguillulae PL171]